MAAETARHNNADTLVDFLRDRAETFGNKDALLFKPGFRYRRWSYADLWNASGRVASMLRQRGLNPGDRALIWAHNSPQWVMTFFGCVRAGVILVPIDLRSPSEFVNGVIERTDPNLAFVSKATPSLWQRIEPPVIQLEDIEEMSDDVSHAEDVPLKPDDLVEIMFTSGTTGAPKGVMLTHQNLLSNVWDVNTIVPGSPRDRLVSILPLSHMFEQTCGMLSPLLGGASIAYPLSRQPSILFRLLQEQRVTMMLVVPQALDLFMRSIEREVRARGKENSWERALRIAEHLPFRLRRQLFSQVHRSLGGKLRVFFAGGAALDPDLARKWELMGFKIIQGYGATEASPVITGHSLENPRHDSAGLPLPSVDVKLADDGEILVKGPNITPGYWNAEESTNASFDDGWYRTGDLGLFDDEGFLHVKGRKKDMIVLPNGQNVFPEDIEAVLLKNPAVNDAVVVGLPRKSRVEIHVVFLMDKTDDASDIVAWANAQLADYQQINAFTVWQDDDFPRTHTLKVKKNLVVEALLSVGEKPVVSETPARKQQQGEDEVGEEGRLLSIIAEIVEMQVRDVSVDSTLGQDLNMDSLGRVELLSAVEAELGVALDENQVNAPTTVGELSRLVEEGASTNQSITFPGWGMRRWCRYLRGSIQRAIMFPLLRLAYRTEVGGTENLRNLEGPVMFAANHNLHSDNPLIIKSMPSKWRKRLAIAAWDEQWRNPLWAITYPLLGNGFPISKGGAIRQSLENMGHLLDDGWSVLIYPEGKLTVGGPIQPFLSGIGLISVEGRLPVIPIRLKIRRLGFPWRYPFLRRGHVEIDFGKPIHFDANTVYGEATKEIEKEIRSL